MKESNHIPNREKFYRRRWFKVVTVLALAYACYISIVQIRLGLEIQAIRDAGHPVTLEELNAWYPAVPDDQNVALQILPIAGMVTKPVHEEFDRGVPFLGYGPEPPRAARLSPRARSQIEQYLQLNAEPARLVRQIKVGRPSRYPIDFRGQLFPDTTHLSMVRQLSILPALEAIILVDDDRVNEAVDRVETIYALARSVDAEPTYMARIHQGGIEGHAFSVLQRLFSHHNLSSDSLDRLRRLLRESAESDTFDRSMVGERAFSLALAEATGLSLNIGSFTDSKGLFWTSYHLGGLGYIDRAKCLSVMGQYVEAVRLENPARFQRFIAIHAQVSALPRYRNHVTQMLCDGYEATGRLSAMNNAMPRCVLTGLAVEQFRGDHGRLPESLEELAPNYLDAVPIDPFDGKPIRYKLLKPGYAIYSVGEDLTEDSARETNTHGSQYGPGTDDVTFTVER